MGSGTDAFTWTAELVSWGEASRLSHATRAHRPPHGRYNIYALDYITPGQRIGTRRRRPETRDLKEQKHPPHQIL
jgi:hypothetical protein